MIRSAGGMVEWQFKIEMSEQFSLEVITEKKGKEVSLEEVTI